MHIDNNNTNEKQDFRYFPTIFPYINETSYKT